jgi:tetratricopeptide (TPR) repeat protein
MRGWRRTALAGAAAVAAATSFVSPIAAQTPEEQVEWCVNKNNEVSTDVRIIGCTALIQSGKSSGQGLSWAFNSRGVAYALKGDRYRAIADFTEAIRLDPKSAIAYNSRGNANREDHDRAIADYTAAIRLDPKSQAYKNRGIVYSAFGDYACASASS